jgi:hypothetical protein
MRGNIFLKLPASYLLRLPVIVMKPLVSVLGTWQLRNTVQHVGDHKEDEHNSRYRHNHFFADHHVPEADYPMIRQGSGSRNRINLSQARVVRHYHLLIKARNKQASTGSA